jgi:hypothetical protein
VPSCSPGIHGPTGAGRARHRTSTTFHTGNASTPDTTFIDWQGVIDSEYGFYDYSTNDGHPRSAYKNWQQAKVTNIVLGATVGTIYPVNLIRSYYNGTYVWSADN